MNEHHNETRWLVTLEEHGVQGTDHVVARDLQQALTAAKTRNPDALILSVKPDAADAPRTVGRATVVVRRRRRRRFTIAFPSYLFMTGSVLACLPSIAIGALIFALGLNTDRIETTLTGAVIMILSGSVGAGAIMLGETCRAIGEIERHVRESREADQK
ncbi:MAG: hypothetical protein AAGH64_11860 [Planctomycetota bacterium]